MAIRFSANLLLSLFLFSSLANTESATSFPVTQICESVARLMENCGAHFYANADTRSSCCRDVKAIMDDCKRRNLNQGERKLLSIAKRFCSDFDSDSLKSPPLSSPLPPQAPSSPPELSPLPYQTPYSSPESSPLPPQAPSSPPESSLPPQTPSSPPESSPLSPQAPSFPPESSPLPPQAPSSPPESSPLPPQAPSFPPESSPFPPQAPYPPPESSPLPSPPPPPQSTPDPTLHRKRPANCLVSTVLYDSCDPKYPEVSSTGSSDERNYNPENISNGFMTDGAGCCLGFALFTNDCNPAIKDLSFANKKLFDSLERACTSSPFRRP